MQICSSRYSVIEVQFPVLQTTDSSEQCSFVSLKQSQHYLALYGKMKIEFDNFLSKFEMKAATFFEQIVNKYSNIVATTLHIVLIK